MSVVHNNTANRHMARAEPSATEVQISKASSKHGQAGDMATFRTGRSMEITAAPAVSIPELLMQPVRSEAGNTCTLHRTHPSSCAGISKVQLQPGSVAAAAAAAAAAVTATTTTLRTHAAAQAAMSAFAAAATAQAAQSAKATNGKPIPPGLRQAPAMAQARMPGSTCAATLLAKQSKLLNQLYHRGERGQRPGAWSAMPNTASTSDVSGCSSASSNNSSPSAVNGRSTGYSSGGCLPGAAYFLIPQPAYHDDHLLPQARGIPKRSGSTSKSMVTAGRAPIAAARKRTVQPERKQAFRLMVEEGPDMMSIHDLDHRAPFRFASSAFQRIAGIDPRNILGRGLTHLIAAEDHVVVQQTLLKVVFSQASGNVVTYRMLTPGGQCLRVETSIRAGDQCIICVARVVSRKQSLLLQSPPPQAVPRNTSALCVASGSGGGINDCDGGVSVCASGGACSKAIHSGSDDGGSDGTGGSGGGGGSGSASSGSNTSRGTKPSKNADADAFATHFGGRRN